MSNWYRAGICIAVSTEFVGALFFASAFHFVYSYATDAGNPLRHEYIVGAMLGLLYGFGAFLAAAFFAILIKKALRKSVFLALSVPALVSGLLLLGYFFVSVATDVLAR